MRAGQWRRGLLTGFLLLVAFWLASLVWGIAGKARIAVDEAHKAQRQYRALEQRRAVLEASVAALETARGRDSAIRTSFGVARPGEEIIVVVPPSPATATPARPWWQNILDWFARD